MKKLLLFVLLAVLSNFKAQAFSGGSGTVEDPYLINDEWDLYDIRSNLSAHYKLVNSLDLTEWIKDVDPTNGWEPIGSSSQPFTGSFDGNGNTIRGLFINRPTTSYIGLFGYVNGTIKDLTLYKPQVVGDQYVAALSGYGDNFSGIKLVQPTISGALYVGSLAGSLSTDQLQNIEIDGASVAVSDYYGGILGGDATSSLSPKITDIIIKNSAITGGNNVGSIFGSWSYYNYVEDRQAIDNVTLYNNSISGGLNVGGAIGALKVHGVGTWTSPTEVRYANISSLNLTNLTINGSTYVGGVIGQSNGCSDGISSSTYIYAGYNNITISGLYLLNVKVNASWNYSGGIIGYATSTSVKNKTSCTENINISNCYVSAKVIANGYASGYGYKTETGSFTISKSRFDGLVKENSNTAAYGFGTAQCDETIFTGSIYGNNIYGIGYRLGNYVNHSVCCADTLSSKTSTLYRIGMAQSTNKNYASSSIVLLQNEEPTSVTDNDNNGISKGLALLKRQTTYSNDALEFDFVNDWAIVQNKTLPYLISQSTAPEISSIANGKVTGTATGNGKVYVFIGQTMYEGTVTDGAWEVTIGSIEADTEVKVSVETEGKKPSIIVKSKAGESSVTPGEYESITLSNTYATYCPTVSVDFTDQTNIKAYAATGYENGTVVLTRVYLVSAGEGVLLKGVAGTYRVKHTDKSSYYTNLLHGVTSTTSISPTSGDKTNFILANGTRGIAFYAVSQTSSLSAGKAYLQLPTVLFEASGRVVNMQFDDETSGVQTLNNSTTSHNNLYDLMGRKISDNQLRRGVYVRQGKKFIVK